MAIFSRLPTFHAWLRDAIRTSTVSQNVIADRLGLDRSRLSRMLNDKEAIPDYLPDLLHHTLFLTPDQVRFGKRLYQADFRARRLLENCHKIRPDALPIASTFLAHRLIKISEDLSFCNLGLPLLSRLNMLIRHLSESSVVVNWIRQFFAHEESLLSPANAPLHILYPFNKLVGALLQPPSGAHLQDDFSHFHSALLSDFRAAASSNVDGLATQHAIHMLARYGSADDQEFVCHHIRSTNLHAMRMAMFGMLCSEAAPEYEDRIICLMDSDSNFANAVLHFDAVHYGDARLHAGSLPATIQSMHNTIAHTLYYITEPNHRTFCLNARKLLALLHIVGPSGFMSTKYLTHIRDALNTSNSNNERSRVLEQFNREFGKLMNDSTSKDLLHD